MTSFLPVPARDKYLIFKRWDLYWNCSVVGNLLPCGSVAYPRPQKALSVKNPSSPESEIVQSRRLS